MLTLGIDIGSTTAKVALLDNDEVIYRKYERHYSKVREKSIEIVEGLRELIGDREFKVSISGSAGFGICKAVGIDFVQEVFATAEAVKFLEPDTDVVIELGGEDAKILFLSGGTEERMNGSCAGGTGAFIDQMVTLLAIDAKEFDEISLHSDKIYPVASRCGVFAKTDVQPLLNQGVNKKDITASIFQAVVDQTISGLAQGRKIGGKVMFLGGPLFFYKGLQKRFQNSLNLDNEHAIFPEYAQYSVAIGVALCARENASSYTCESLINKLIESKNVASKNKYLEPLFVDSKEYEQFLARHRDASVESISIDEAFEASGFQKIPCYLGIDCGSTTTKLVIIDEFARILYEFYNSNQGNPASVIFEQLSSIYERFGDKITIKGSAVTGYGEELIKAGFNLDSGLVETMAHLKAAQHFNPQVDFIIDIGGQDIKCFYIKNQTIDSIMLNEACSSGCGSFIETFARSMGYDVATFSKLGLESKHPVELGSRCTVFMNSSVKEAQKEGACIEDISAGLSMSVVKNAIYKVIRARDADDLGKQIVVQGGTFYNDAVLRSFEKEIGRNVIRPKISGLMGAFGAALYAQSLNLAQSSIISPEALKNFHHTATATICKLCGNHCNLTINKFGDTQGAKKFISGNRCDKPLGFKKVLHLPNMHDYKLTKLKDLFAYKHYDKARSVVKFGSRGKIGIPLGLNMYENLPFWHTLLSELGYEVVVSDITTRKTYAQGQYSIPSDTVCYPAKLQHGHIENLMNQGIKLIFYPCMGYSFASSAHNNDTSTNNYNCPVVAYYPELLNANVDRLREVRFLYPYFGLHKKDEFFSKSLEFFKKELGASKGEFKKALERAYTFREDWLADVQREGERNLAYIKEHNLKAIVLSGRPYHIDPEINHGIDKLINSLGLVVLSEDSIAHLATAKNLQILNQWSYHSRLYNAAEFVCEHENIELVQLVSFGCGIDSITTDEVRAILESRGRFYTQLKIDEISNLGAVKIRIRSLLGAMEEKLSGKKPSFAQSILFHNTYAQNEIRKFMALTN
ncbi:2-hydroxyglutaryl-CoA dehydratase component A [Helicobacter fennelliae]|uniref:Activator of (R)-2-hydroxyglutaryl-CoA dehydratase n=2 Tax=Helicobacter fennelliae TaxID=215 RepID=T1DVU9_9HELI|nr:acyl-CoA dehydratase activase [Helicobacter fennelliae]GAD18857.1 hypothetical protein HFN_2269 [Helicobacter fennelliae MRY12-0050]SQB97507.1 2-hydroxyglutaryl-CoA dehydratase component A [Helicobacter fennelliae]STP06989.1 2-hydroxyglutaryl-CoA dehydratase component A [Helicobacter fennelliae]